MNRHIFFVEDEKADSFDLAEHLDTDPALLHRVHNRPTKSQLQEMSEMSSAEAKVASVERGKTMRELEQRLARLKKLENAAKALENAENERLEEQDDLEVKNKYLAQKFNFTQLRKK